MNSALEPKTCSRCGAPLTPGALEGHCPRCLLALNLGTHTAVTGDEADLPAAKPASPPEAPPVQEIARHFPGLEILELLGCGGMGAVYKARQKSLDRIVALKILPPRNGDESAFAERFTREAKSLAKLLHPNIVTLFEFGQADGIYYLLMEFVDGASLGQLLRSRRISSREALAIMPQICDALQYAHDHGIVHRDIKPENILLDRRGQVKVADFGLAKMVEGREGSHLGSETDGGTPVASPASDLTAAGKIMGTPRYMSPEQFQAPGEVDHRTDIYALGVVLYQMLTGELPGKPIEPPSQKIQIDVRLDEIVLCALEEKPERRYPQASLLKTAVETVTAAHTASLPAGAGFFFLPLSVSIVRKLPAPVVFCLTVFVCCWWAIAANLASVAHHAPGTTPPAHALSDNGVLWLGVAELVGLALMFRIGRIRGWPFVAWGFQPSWIATGAGLVLGLGASSPKFVALAFAGMAVLAWTGRLRGWSFATWKSQSSPASTGADVLLCFPLYLLIWAGNQLAEAIHPGTVQPHLALTSHLSLPFLISTVALNPVFEETVETGLFIQSLQRYGIWIAVLASALFRGFLHARLGLGALVGNFSLGLLFGFIYWKWRRLWPLIVAHALFDAWMFLRAYVA